jgi:hypothetical protein
MYGAHASARSARVGANYAVGAHDGAVEDHYDVHKAHAGAYVARSYSAHANV